MVTLRDTTRSISSLRKQGIIKAHKILKRVVNILIKKYQVSSRFTFSCF